MTRWQGLLWCNEWAVISAKKGVRSSPKKWDIIIRTTHKKRVLTFATILEKVEWRVSFIIAACVLRPYEFSAFPSAKFLMDAKIIRPCAARVICSLQILVTNYIFSKQDYCCQYFRSPVQKDFLLFSMERWPKGVPDFIELCFLKKWGWSPSDFSTIFRSHEKHVHLAPNKKADQM